MAITINGSGTVTGISAGGLPDGCITTDELASTVNVAKAWVNFNGTSTVAIRASFNVSSITDNGTGDYTVNFTTALADGNYSFGFGSRQDQSGMGGDCFPYSGNNTGSTDGTDAMTSSSIRILFINNESGTNARDQEVACINIFR
jgi:hypothetical protein